MAAAQYTHCYNEADARIIRCGPVLPMILAGIGPAFVYGAAVAGALAAFLFGTGAAFLALPVALAIIGYGFLAGFYQGFMSGLCDQWHNHRLVCLDAANDPHCAIGRAARSQEEEDKGGETKEPFFPNFDTDTTFNLALMPHPPANDSEGHVPPTSKNFLFGDAFQGELFLIRRLFGSWDWSDDPKQHVGKRFLLHCEFETNLWFKICELSKLLAPLAPIVMAVVDAAAEAACHAVAASLGPFGALLGGVLCHIIAALLALAVMVFITLLLGAAIADQGKSAPSNVGEVNPKPIQEGEPLVVSGNFVYDAGHCVGWHELHPVLKWRRVLPREGYLEHDTTISDPAKLPSLPVEVKAALKLATGVDTLTLSDVQNGLDSSTFAKAAMLLKEHWCGMLHQAENPAVRTQQLTPEERWAVHPSIDGCESGPVIK